MRFAPTGCSCAATRRCACRSRSSTRSSRGSAMWRLLQLADSAFPIGGFAHSGGLEAASQAGLAPDLRAFVREALWQAGLSALPLVRAAFEEPAALPGFDARAEAFLANHVATRASRTQGRAFHSTCARVFPGRLEL